MTRSSLGRALGVSVATVAVLNTLAALSMPVPERQTPLPVILTWFVLMAVQAVAFGWGSQIRGRLGLGPYAGIQAAILFAITLARLPAPLTIVLYMAAVAELATLAGTAWGTARITIAGIILLVLASLIAGDLYRAVTNGAILAVTGLLTHTIGAMINRPAGDGARATALTPAPAPALSDRENEVLRELVNGARNSDIAVTLGISERTVKAHLGSIYQKLGVESRTAAIAAALRRQP